MGEKGNLVPDPVAAMGAIPLDAIPLDVLKGSPETMNAWIDTYLKTREIQEARQPSGDDAAVDAADPEAAGPPTTGEPAG